MELEISRSHLNGIVRHSCFSSFSFYDGQSDCISLEIPDEGSCLILLAANALKLRAVREEIPCYRGGMLEL